MDKFLKPTFFMNSDNEIVKKFVFSRIKNLRSDKDKAVALFYAVRDEIFYSPYNIDFTKQGMQASSIIERKVGYCVAKAVALAAALKSAGIPSTIGLADVKNHLTTKRLKDVMGTDIFYDHGYTLLYLDGRWLKVTPTFNKELCDKFKVKPIDFNGEEDALFHEFDQQGHKHMSYIKDYGSFDELPFEIIKKRAIDLYSGLFTKTDESLSGDFEKEAEEEFGE